MANYRRAYVKGGSYFFTVVTHERSPILIEHIECLRAAFKQVKQQQPYHLEAVVILPEHLHCIMTLPPGDADFSLRWRLIKSEFSRALPLERDTGASSRRKGERGIWQRRYWEHVIRDEMDFNQHMDYLHYNPVKHGHVAKVSDWPYSSFHRWVKEGVYDPGWGGEGLDTGLDYE